EVQACISKSSGWRPIPASSKTWQSVAVGARQHEGAQLHFMLSRGQLIESLLTLGLRIFGPLRKELHGLTERSCLGLQRKTHQSNVAPRSSRGEHRLLAKKGDDSLD